MNAEEVRAELARVIEHGLSFLRGLGFDFTGVCERFTDATRTYFEASFTNETVNRIVRVVYYPKHDGPRAVAFTRIELVVPEPRDDFDYTSTGSMQVCVTDLSTPAGDFAARFGAHLRVSGQILRDQFMKVLRGGAWKSDALDWGGLK